jgi:hypothetical protein
MEQGFKLVPDTCNWIDDAAQVDAGVYPVEEANGVSKYRIQYRSRHHRVDSTPTNTPPLCPEPAIAPPETERFNADPPQRAPVVGVRPTRRTVMNSLVALPIAVAIPVASPAASMLQAPDTDRRALEAYASWLLMERRILCGELWPHMGAEAERYDWFDNAGAGWHFHGRGDLAWDEGPQPSSRAARVLDLVGVDWRQPKRDMGLNHEDTGHRPELPPGWPAIHPDARLFEIKEEVFRHKEAISALEPEVDRLSDIWTKENKRMHDEFEATRIAPTFEEREAILAAMPEFKEYMRLRELQELHREPADNLVKQMWEINAQTPEGKRAKVLVLLGYVMEGDEWRRTFDEPFDVTRARDLMIEFVGGEPAAQLRDQFAA